MMTDNDGSLRFKLGDSLKGARTKEGKPLADAVLDAPPPGVIRRAKRVKTERLDVRPFEEWDAREQAVVRWAVEEVLGLDFAWATQVHREFRRPAMPVTTDVTHRDADAEAWWILWQRQSNEPVRTRFHLAANRRLAFIHPGPSLPEEPLFQSLGLAPAQLTAHYLEEHGFQFVDCGGGGARLDSHGRPENAVASQIASNDLFIAGILDLLYGNFLHMLAPMQLISRHDKFGEWLAKDYARARSPWPNTDRSFKNMLDGWNALAREERTLSFERIGRYAFLCFDAVERERLAKIDELCKRYGDPQSAEDDIALYGKLLSKKEGRKYWIFLYPTIAEHLPPAPTKEEAEAAGQRRARSVISDAFADGTGIPLAVLSSDYFRSVTVDRKKLEEDPATLVVAMAELTARYVVEERDKAAGFPDFVAEIHRRTRRGFSLMEDSLADAERDWQAWHKTVFLDDCHFFQKDERNHDPKRFHARRGKLAVVMAASESNRFGGLTRRLANRKEQARVEPILIAAWREAAARLGSMEAVRLFFSLEAKAPGPKLTPPRIFLPDAPSAADPVADSVTVKPEALDSIELPTEEPEEEEAADRPSPDRLVTEQDCDALAAEGKTERAERLRRYVGVPSVVATRLQHVVGRIRGDVITIQLWDTVVRDGDILDSKEGISSSQVILTDVAETVRREVLAASGGTPVNPDLRTVGPLMQRIGDLVIQRDHFPDFRSFYGRRFKTNQRLPRSGLSAEKVFEAVVQGLIEGSDRIEQQVAEGALTLRPPDWEAYLPFP